MPSSELYPYDKYCIRGHRRSEFPCPQCKPAWDRYYQLKEIADQERDLAALTSQMLAILAEATGGRKASP